MKNIHVEALYDLLVECLEVESPKHIFVEVKSHLKHILVAELTDSETKFAEMHPLDYVVCNIMGLENKNPESWTTICEVYAELPKIIVKTTKEEKRARIYFTH